MPKHGPTAPLGQGLDGPQQVRELARRDPRFREGPGPCPYSLAERLSMGSVAQGVTCQRYPNASGVNRGPVCWTADWPTLAPG